MVLTTSSNPPPSGISNALRTKPRERIYAFSLYRRLNGRRLSNLFMIKLHRTGAPVHFAFFRSTPLLIGRFTKPPNMGLLSVTRTFQHSENSRLFNED